jgi:hypothetical protein
MVQVEAFDSDSDNDSDSDSQPIGVKGAFGEESV